MRRSVYSRRLLPASLDPPLPPPPSPAQHLAGTLAALSVRLTFLYLCVSWGPWQECHATASCGQRMVCVDAKAADLASLLSQIAGAARCPREDGPQELGELLVRLATRCRTLTLLFPRPDDECPIYEVEWTPRREGRPGIVCRSELVEAVREAAGEPEAEKVCPQCATSKPLSEYPKDRSRPSGRFSWCRECNRRHVRAYHRRCVN